MWQSISISDFPSFFYYDLTTYLTNSNYNHLITTKSRKLFQKLYFIVSLYLELIRKLRILI